MFKMLTALFLYYLVFELFLVISETAPFPVTFKIFPSARCVPAATLVCKDVDMFKNTTAS